MTVKCQLALLPLAIDAKVQVAVWPDLVQPFGIESKLMPLGSVINALTMLAA